MKRFIANSTLLFTFIYLSSCSKTQTVDSKISTEQKNKTATTVLTSAVIKGFNQNWAQLPALTNTVMLSNINQLKPGMLRYPGGTLGNNWSWQDGRILPAIAWHPVHPLTDLVTLKNATGAKTIFMLNMITRSVEDQIQMLDSARKLGIAIEYVELGNELYAKDEGYDVRYPTGAEYADTVRNWVPKIRAAFPGVKIASLLFGRKVNASNTRMYNWNSLVVSGTSAVVDAFTYHIYIADGSSFAAKKTEFEQVRAAVSTGTKPLWITEYGNMNSNTNSNYLAQVDSLANYMEAYPNVAAALSHQIISPSLFNKLTPDGNSFTAEGLMFLQRVQ